MRNVKIDPKLHEHDQFFVKNYARLTNEYLGNVAHHANLDDVINKLVSLEDGDCITNYSGNLSRIIHRSLKDNSIKETVLVKDFEVKLFQALKRLPNFNNQLIYRMENDAENESIPNYQAYFKDKIGKVMSINYYLSTSKDEWEDQKVIYRIKSLVNDSNARDISRITNNAIENEVLYIKNTHFLIKDMRIINSVLYIDLEETIDAASFIYNYVEIGFTENNLDEELGLYE